jgi:hypothetical protein
VCPIDQTPFEETRSKIIPTPTTPTTPTDPPPTLWNPNAAACWSLLFSPAFGAFLHARNAESLGRTDEAKANRVWFYISLAYLGFVLVSIFVPVIPNIFFNVAAIVLLLRWYFSLGKKHIQYVKETWQNRYQRKPWAKPLLVGLGCFLGYLIVCVILGIIASSLFGIE